MHYVAPTPLVRFALAAAGAAAALACSTTASAQTLTADYRFEGTRASSVGAAPALVDLGSNSFATETVDGTPRTVLRFAMNDGLSLAPATAVMPAERYTIVMLFRFQSVSGFRRIFDVHGGTRDEGAYVENGRLKHSNGPPIAPNTYVQVVYTRDGSTESQRAYVDGQLAVNAGTTEVTDLALTGTTLRFFRDDAEFPNEASAGAVARIRIYDGPLSATQVAALERLPAPAGDPADVAVSFEDLAPAAGSGSLYVFNLRVTNLSAAEAPEVSLTVPTPEGTVFSSAASSQGSCAAPAVGAAGDVVCSLGSLGPGASATATIVVAVTAPPGLALAATAEVSSAAPDPDASNDTAHAVVPVEESDVVTLMWERPAPPTAAEPLPPPANLVTLNTGGASALERRLELVGYNVYRANAPGVAPAPGSFFASVPPNETSVPAAVAPGGTFFVVTAVYDEGESGPSNETSAGVEAGTILRVKIAGAKVTVTGAGFSDAVTVFVDGIPFASPAKVKKANTKVVQKGVLLTGVTAAQYLATRSSVLITVRNSNGGVAAFRYPQ
jgi:hypothetical protein